MTLGTNNKNQVIALSVLGLVAAYLVYSNLIAGPDVPKSTRRAAAPTAAVVPAPGVAPGPAGGGPPAAKRTGSARVRSEAFNPVYLNKNPTKRRDVSTIDPTLQLEKFAKVQSVEVGSASRNVFQFAAAPPPVAVASKPAGPEPTIYIAQGPRQPPPPPPPAPPPPPPPITLKFYGFSTPTGNGKKTAYLLDGDEIYLASEGDTLKRRYKIVRIGPTSILIEDLDAKRQQAVPLTEEGAG